MRYRYLAWDERFAQDQDNPPFDQLWDLFQELLTITGGDVNEALNWLTDLDRTYDITDDFEDYNVGDFIEELAERGYIKYDDEKNQVIITGKTERSIRERALKEIFRSLRKDAEGDHKTDYAGKSLERKPESRKWEYGDDIGQLDSTSTMMNMLKHSSLDQFDLREDDLQIYDTDHYTSAATVLMIDLSHSMVLYGEDRITPAKKTAMALSELIMKNFSNDSLDIIAFGNDAWKINIKDLPYLQVGPYHTNTQAALKMGRHLLQRKKFKNKQIFMITDGKPSCIIENGQIYKNSFGLDRKIINRVLDEAVKCRRNQIEITTFMVARDPYLQNFVEKLTEANKGRAYYTSLDNLGGYIFADYIRNRQKRVR